MINHESLICTVMSNISTGGGTRGSDGVQDRYQGILNKVTAQGKPSLQGAVVPLEPAAFLWIAGAKIPGVKEALALLLSCAFASWAVDRKVDQGRGTRTLS